MLYLIGIGLVGVGEIHEENIDFTYNIVTISLQKITFKIYSEIS